MSFLASGDLAAAWAARRARELLEAPRRLRAPGQPVPPRRLRARTGVPSALAFRASGGQAARELLDALEALGADPAAVTTVLDLGCGSGRVLPHVAGLMPGAACIGCDVDPAAISWAARHHPRQDWLLAAAQPPLPLAPASIAFLYSISVLSHLDEPGQDAWLAEIARVLAPGGTALVSVHGPHAFEQFRTGAVRSRWCPPQAFARGPLGAEEFVFEPYRRSVWNAVDLPGVAPRYGLAFHGHDYLRGRLPAGLEMIEIQPRAITAWQDLAIARRRG